MNILKMSALSEKTLCREEILDSLFKCCLLINEYSPSLKKTNDEIFEIFTRDFYCEEDMYYVLKVNAYWCDVESAMSGEEVQLLHYMLERAKLDNVGVMSVLYSYFNEHYMYDSDEHHDERAFAKVFDEFFSD